MSFLFDYYRSFLQAFEYGRYIKEDITLPKTSKEKIALKFLSKNNYKIIRTLWLFFKGKNLFLDKRRNEIRKIILDKCDKPSKTLRRIRNYMIDEKDINEIKYSLCFGIYDDLNFEDEISKTYSIPVIAADPTPIAVQFISKYKKASNFQYIEAALSTKNGIQKFYNADDSSENAFEGSLENIGKSKEYIEVNCMNLEKFVELAGQNDLKNCLLKMDIEGGALTIMNDLLYKKDKYGIDLPIQIAAEIEVPKKIDTYFYEKIKDISDLFVALKKYYSLYYIARMKRFTNVDILLVRK